MIGTLLLLPARGLAWGYFLLPPALKRGAGVALGLGLRLLRLRAKVISENLKIAFPGEEHGLLREELFREAYRHLGNLILEILLLLGPMKQFIESSVEMRGVSNAEAALAKGRGIILLSSHVGNWESMAAGGALLGGLELKLVTKRIKPEFLHRAIEAGRLKCKVHATYEPRTMRDVLAWLKEGKCVGFVLDQYAGP